MHNAYYLYIFSLDMCNYLEVISMNYNFQITVTGMPHVLILYVSIDFLFVLS